MGHIGQQHGVLAEFAAAAAAAGCTAGAAERKLGRSAGAEVRLDS